jgi:hypothetical protein
VEVEIETAEEVLEHGEVVEEEEGEIKEDDREVREDRGADADRKYILLLLFTKSA